MSRKIKRNKLVNNMQPVYDSIIFTMFNITFSALPIIVFGVFEQNFTDKQLLEHLHLYRNLSGNANMSWGQFLKWNLLGTTRNNNLLPFSYFNYEIT